MRVFFPVSCAWLDVTVADSLQDPRAATPTVISMIGMLACIFMGFPSGCFRSESRLQEYFLQVANRNAAAEAVKTEKFSGAFRPRAKVIERANKSRSQPRAAYSKARIKLENSARPTPQAFALMAQEAMLRETKPKNDRKSAWDNLFPSAGARELSNLLKFIDKTEWADGRYRSVLLGLLVDHGYHQRVIRYWRKNQARVNRETESWSQVARSLVSLDRKEEARALLAEWRQRDGVAMWVVATYISCFSRADQSSWNEVLSTCKDALAGIQHDHCAKYLAHVQAEICAVQGDSEGFRESWQKHRAYFSGQCHDSEWFDARRKHLLRDIPEMAALLDQSRNNLFLEKCGELRKKLAFSPPATMTGGSTRGFNWWWFWLLWILLSMLTEQFHR